MTREKEREGHYSQEENSPMQHIIPHHIIFNILNNNHIYEYKNTEKLILSIQSRIFAVPLHFVHFWRRLHSAKIPTPERQVRENAVRNEIKE